MKKAKLFLGAFAVLAIVGSTLAFKSASLSNETIYGASSSGVTPTVTIEHAIVTQQVDLGQFLYTTDSPTGSTGSTQVWVTTAAE